MKKFSKKLLWYRLIINIFTSIMLGFVTFSQFLPEEDVEVSPDIIKTATIISFLVIIISYALLALYQVLYYKNTGYQLNENEIICVRGVLFKKKSILEYKKIHAINSKQNIIEKLFGISILQIDSGSTNTAQVAEIQIIEDDNVVKDLMRIIKAKQNNDEVLINKTENQKEDVELEKSNKTIESIYNFDSKRKVIYAALQVAWFVVGGGIALFFGVIAMLILLILKEMELPLFLLVLGGVLLVIVIVSIFSFVLGLIGSIIAYYDFKLTKNKNNIEVSYGLVTKINNTFKFDKIKAIRISQSIIQKIFGFVTVRVEVIGYTIQSDSNNNSATTGMLIPLCKKSELNTILENLLPNYIPVEKQIKSKKFIPFISYHVLFSFIVFILIQIVITIFLCYYGYSKLLLIVSGILWTVYLISIAIVLIERKFAQINSGLSLEGEKLCIYRGSLVQEIIVMRKQNIIGIDAKTTYFRKKKNIYSYKIHFRSNASTNTVTVLNVNQDEANKIYELIKY